MRQRSLHSLGVLVLFLIGCVSGSLPVGKALPAPESWVMMPLINESETSLADESANSLLQAHLRNRGVNAYEANNNIVSTSSAQHVVTGRVVDWQYSNLTRPKPKVTIDLRVYDMKSQELLWQQERTRTGGSGDSVVTVADSLLAQLVSRIDVSSTLVARQQNDDAALNVAVQQLASQVSPSNSNLTHSNSGLFGGAAAAIRVNSDGTSADLNTVPTLTQPIDQFAPGGSIAIYYAVNPPVSMLREFDRVVLEPDAVSDVQLAEFNTSRDSRTTLFSYLSVGEVGPSRQWRSSIDTSWVLGENRAWNSQVMDMANPAWREFLLHRANELVRRGFQGFFLDTMDSYQLYAQTQDEKLRQQQGLIAFVTSLKSQHPNIQLISNRGFELLPSIGQHLNVIAAESLYARWHGGTGGYQAVPQNDREWLLAQLINARNQYGLEALSIDYVQPSLRDDARQVARTISSHGIIPWVSTPGLDQVGVGLEEVFPREVLLLFDSRVDGPVEHTFVHRFAAYPLEYLGYVPRYVDISKEVLPEGNLSGQYAGVVAWTEGNYNRIDWPEWLMKQKNLVLRLLLQEKSASRKLQNCLPRVTDQSSVLTSSRVHSKAYPPLTMFNCLSRTKTAKNLMLLRSLNGVVMA